MATSYATYADIHIEDRALCEHLLESGVRRSYEQNDFSLLTVSDKDSLCPKCVITIITSWVDWQTLTSYIQGLLEHATPGLAVYVRWNEGCSKPRSSELYGQMLRITKDTVISVTTKEIIEKIISKDGPIPSWFTADNKNALFISKYTPENRAITSYYYTCGNNISVTSEIRQWVETNIAMSELTPEALKRFYAAYPNMRDRKFAEIYMDSVTGSLSSFGCSHNLNVDWGDEDVSLDAECTAAVLQFMLKEVGSTQALVFDWLMGCAYEESDAIYGGICHVTKDQILYTTTKDLCEMSEFQSLLDLN